MIEINTLKAYEEVLEKKQYSVMVFTSHWCIDCLTIKPVLKRLEKLYPTVNFYWVNRERVSQLSIHLNIVGVPSLLFYEQDRCIATLISKKPKSFKMLQTFIESAINDVRSVNKDVA